MRGCHIVSERECMDLKEARTATKFNFSPPSVLLLRVFIFTERLLRKKACYLRVEA